MLGKVMHSDIRNHASSHKQHTPNMSAIAKSSLLLQNIKIWTNYVLLSKLWHALPTHWNVLDMCCILPQIPA